MTRTCFMECLPIRADLQERRARGLPVADLFEKAETRKRAAKKDQPPQP